MEKIMQKQVSDFMTREVVAVTENESIKKVFNLMEKHGILGVPVLNEEGAVIGMVTESDLIRHFTTLREPASINLLGSLIYLGSEAFNQHLKDHCAEVVKDIMTTDIITITHDKKLSDVINLMAEKKVNRVPVIGEKGGLVGIVTRTDVLHQLAQLNII